MDVHYCERSACLDVVGGRELNALCELVYTQLCIIILSCMVDNLSNNAVMNRVQSTGAPM